MIIIITKGGYTNTFSPRPVGQQPGAIPDEASEHGKEEFEITNPLAERRIEQLIKRDKSQEATLRQIFPEREDENRIQTARRIMGDEIKDLSDQELEVYLTEFQYLINSWLDGYEQEIYNGKTLEQVIREGI